MQAYRVLKNPHVFWTVEQHVTASFVECQETWQGYADDCVNDAFGSCHRTHMLVALEWGLTLTLGRSCLLLPTEKLPIWIFLISDLTTRVTLPLHAPVRQRIEK